MLPTFINIFSCLTLLLKFQGTIASLFPAQNPLLQTQQPVSNPSSFPVINEQTLYSNIDFNQFRSGYGSTPAAHNTVERLDLPMETLPPVEAHVHGTDRVFDYFQSTAASAAAAPEMVQTSSQVVQTMPEGITEQMLYANLGNFNQFAEGYPSGAARQGRIERVNLPEQELPTIYEEKYGFENVVDHTLPDVNVSNEVNSTKQINTFTIQNKTTHIFNQNIHRYLKTLLVNTKYTTNVQRINHPKEFRLLINQQQDIHEPLLLVKYERKDVVNNLVERNEPPVFSTRQRQEVITLPPVILPAQVERIGYNGLPIAAFNNSDSARQHREFRLLAS